MKHYTNKKTNEVYGYESNEVAKEYNDDFENLVKMTDDQFIDFRDNRPKGGKWTWDKGWIIDEEILAQEESEELEFERQDLKQRIQEISIEIQEHILMDEKDEAKNKVLEKRKLEEEEKELDGEITRLRSVKSD